MGSFENELFDRKEKERLQSQEQEDERLRIFAQEEAEQERARQAEYIRQRTATSLNEALGEDATVASEFLAFMKKNRFPGSRSMTIVTATRQEHSNLFAAVLNKPTRAVDATSLLRGYTIGRRTPSADGHYGGEAETTIILCEDETVREGKISRLYPSSGYDTVGNIDAPGFQIGLYDHEEHTTESTRDYFRDVTYPLFHEMSLKETLLAIADNAIAEPTRSYEPRRR